MPKFDYLSDSHLVAINSFLLGKAWESYEDEDNVPYEKENTNKFNMFDVRQCQQKWKLLISRMLACEKILLRMRP